MARNKTETAENLSQETLSDTGTEEKVLDADAITNMSDEEFEKYLEELSAKEPDEEITDEKGGEEDEESDSITEDKADESDTDAEDVPADEEPAPFKTFATEAEYEAEIEKRIKDATPKEEKKSNPAVDKITKLAKKLYGDSEDPLSDVADELEKQYAESEGMDVEELRSKMSTEEDAKKYRDEQDKKKKADDDRESIIKKWNDEAELIKHIDPDFDFKKALADEKFKDALLEGKSVHEAYMMLEKAETKEETKEESKEEEKKEDAKREPLDQNGRNPRKGTGEGKANPAKLSDADFKKYIENIKNS